MRFPACFPQSEADALNRGIEQRATAIHMFLQEYYSGGTSWTQAVPKAVIDKIVQRNGESGYMGQIRPETIAFPYGPGHHSRT